MTTEDEQKVKIKATRTSLIRGLKLRARLQRRVRHVGARNKRKEARLQHQRLKLKEIQSQPRSGGARAAADWGLRLSSGGVVEHPAFSNKGPYITQWEVNSGYSYVPNAREGVPWCQCFANAFMAKAGLPQLKTGYTVTVVEFARKNLNGLRLIYDKAHGHGSLAGLKIGDLIYYKWPGVSSAECDHVGVYVGGGRVLEGNTSPGNSGSQNNGGGLYVRHLGSDRSTTLVSHAIRPNYN